MEEKVVAEREWKDREPGIQEGDINVYESTGNSFAAPK
jgi:hypothetical protein